MGRMPDITPLIYFGIFGIVCAAAISLVLGGWATYHIVMAVALYAGIL